LLAWQQGRGSWVLESVLDELTPGQVAAEPVEWENDFYLPRLDRQIVVTEGRPAPAPVASFPLPEVPDVEFFARQPSVTALAAQVRGLATAIARELGFEGASAEQFVALHRVPAALDWTGPRPARRAAIRQMLRGIEGELGPRYPAYVHAYNGYVNGWIAAALREESAR
jgi:hypothetical protein